MSILFEQIEETAQQLRELKASKCIVLKDNDYVKATEIRDMEYECQLNLIHQLKVARQQMTLLDPHSLDYAELTIRYNSIMIEQEWDNSEKIGAFVLVNKQKQKEIEELQEEKKELLGKHQFSEANKVRDRIQQILEEKLANQRNILELKKRMEMFQSLTQ